MPVHAERLALLDRLIHLHDELLAALHAGAPPDLEAFDSDALPAFERLRGLPAATADEVPSVRPRLVALADRNGRLMAALAELREESGRRLVALEQGRRGLAGYRGAIPRSPGARLGKG